MWIAFGNLNEENGTENISETDEIKKIFRTREKFNKAIIFQEKKINLIE